MKLNRPGFREARWVESDRHGQLDLLQQPLRHTADLWRDRLNRCQASKTDLAGLAKRQREVEIATDLVAVGQGAVRAAVSGSIYHP